MGWIASWWERKKEEAKDRRRQHLEEQKRKSEETSEHSAKERILYDMVHRGFLREAPSRDYDTDRMQTQGLAGIPFVFGVFTFRLDEVGTNLKTKKPYLKFHVFTEEERWVWVGFDTSYDKTKSVIIEYSRVDDWQNAIVDSLSAIGEEQVKEQKQIATLIEAIKQAVISRPERA